MTLGAYLKSYLKQCLEVFRHPRQLLPTLILAVVWIVLGIVQNKVQDNLPLRILNFLTFAQGGLYGGIFGAIGGLFGKIVVAAFVNAMVVPLFQGGNPFSGMRKGFHEALETMKKDGKSALSLLLLSSGTALIIYTFFNSTQSFQNSLVGIVGAVSALMALTRKRGFLWGLIMSFLQTVSKGKAPSAVQVSRALTGMSVGFSLGVLLSVFGSAWGGSLGLFAVVAGWLTGRGKSKSAAMALLLLLPSLELEAEGKWSLVDIKTEVNPTAKSTNSNGAPITVKLSGTTASYRVDYTYGDDAGWFSGNITPFTASYAPGAVFTGESKAKLEEGNRWLDLVIYNWNRFWHSYAGVGREDAARIGWELRDDLGPFQYTFPTRTEVGGDRFTIYEEVSVFDAFIRTSYYFEWNAKGKTVHNESEGFEEEEDDMEITFPEWVEKLFGADGEHAPDGWTILIGVTGAAGGAAGAALGGAGGGGVPPPNLPEGPDGPEPGPLEEDPRRKKYLRSNPDGTKTLTDPVTGKQQTLYPQFNPETGEPDGWVNENDTHYSEEGLDEWLDWRERNSDTFKQDADQADAWKKEQHDANEARNKADRDRRSSSLADKYREEKKAAEDRLKHELYVDDVASRLGMDSRDEEKLKTALKKEKLTHEQESAEHEKEAAQWDERIAELEFVEEVADNTINVLGEATPETKMIKNFYNFAKPVTKATWTGLAQHKDGTGLMKEIGKGVIDGTMNVVQNEAGNERWGTGLLNKATGGYVGRTIGAEVIKSVGKDLLDDDPKSWSEILDNATQAATERTGYEITNKIMGGLGGKATGGTPEGVAEVVSFGTEMGSLTTSNPLADELAHDINNFRKSTLGI